MRYIKSVYYSKEIMQSWSLTRSVWG